MNYLSSNFKIGILGGGQLGRMFLNETIKYDIQTAVLDSDPNAPCKNICNTFEIGDLMDFDTVYNFGKQYPVVTFEIEHINVKALERLENEGVKVYPSPKTLKIIQDKRSQKEFYKTNHIPTADFKCHDSLPTNLTPPFVWKSAQFGYDGYGVKIIQNIKQQNNLPNEACITEELVPFKYEIAVIVARNSRGNSAIYPPVEMEFHPEANQVEYVICPAQISEFLRNKVINVALQVSKAFNHIGLLAVEMFITESDDVLVNEVAPRPHNSGHYTIEASNTNQFEQHLRAILNFPLGSTVSKSAAVMVNLVGSENYSGDVHYENLEDTLKIEGATPHIYGKKQTRPFRKMGHITVTHSNIEKAKALAEEVKSTIKVISK